MTVQLESWENRLLTLAYAPLEEWTSEHIHMPHDRDVYEKAYAVCDDITREHSATFYTSSALLNKEQRQAIRALYAFCRVSDDLIDRPDTGDVTDFLRWQDHALSNRPPEDDLVALAWAETRRKFNIPRQYAEQLLDGVASDLSINRYETFDDLAKYCYSVASTVGLMSMHVVGYSNKAAIPYAVKLGVALQLTNILRDVKEDWHNGRLYLPQDELRAFGLSEADIANEVNDARWQAFMRFQINRARQLYIEAMPGLAMLERRGRVAVAAAAELYREILTDIERHNYDVFTRRAYISNGGKAVRIPGIWWRAYNNKYGRISA